MTKRKVDRVLVRGCDGDISASLCTGINHAGAQLEFGIAGTHQAFVLNGFIVVPTTSSYRSLSMVLASSLHAPVRWSLLSQSSFVVPINRESKNVVSEELYRTLQPGC